MTRVLMKLAIYYYLHFLKKNLKYKMNENTILVETSNRFSFVISF